MKEKRWRTRTTVIWAVLLIVLIFVSCKSGNKPGSYSEWVDYSSFLGMEETQVLDALEKDKVEWTETDGGILLKEEEHLEGEHAFKVTVFFNADSRMYGIRKQFIGRKDADGDFVVSFYKQMHELYGTPEQEGVPRYDTWEDFYGCLLDIGDSKGMTAIWKEKGVALDIKVTPDDRVHILYLLVNDADQPYFMPIY